MATTPTIVDAYGTSNSAISITTNKKTFTIKGICGSDTVDLMVSIGDGVYTSDLKYIYKDGNTWEFPNPYYFSDGVTLESGLNAFRIKAVDILGNESSPVYLGVTQQDTSLFSSIFNPPSGVDIARNATSVSIKWSNNGISNAVGFNIYASPSPGGGDFGYTKLNANMIPISSSASTYTDKFGAENLEYYSDSVTPNSNILITIDEVDASTGTFKSRKFHSTFSNIASDSFHMFTNFERTKTYEYYEFVHDRSYGLSKNTINNGIFNDLATSAPVYYVVTAVYVDSFNNEYLESSYSNEVVGNPFYISSLTRSIPTRSTSQIVNSYIQMVNDVVPGLSLIPGSTVREVHIEPFSVEMAKTYFIMDFVHKANSFPALLDVDDMLRTGTSTPVSESNYKTSLKSALSINDDASVQNIIDMAFDSLANNFGVTRPVATPAVVNQTFYLTTAPTQTYYIPQNTIVSNDSGSIRFKTYGSYSLTPLNSSSYYNPTTRRYEIVIPMTSVGSGSDNNVPAGTLTKIVSGATGLSTINAVAASGAVDYASNLKLAELAMRSIAGVDSGTQEGIHKLVASTPGVSSFMIVKAGDGYMMRDYDFSRDVHTGGKVDVYCYGSSDRSITETFSSTYLIARNVRFDVVDPVNYVFRARDSRLTESTPILDILNSTADETGLKNHTAGGVLYYDVSGINIINYNTISLKAPVQPDTKYDDFITGDIRFRNTSKFIPSIQPVSSVTSIIGEVSGTLDPAAGYTLYKTQDPLIDGFSTKSQDYILIEQNNGIPSGQPITITNESHVLIGELEEKLFKIGANVLNIVVTDSAGVVFNGPSKANPDYLVIPGNDRTAVSIRRTENSGILNGSTVLVSYSYDENFTITYNVNDILHRVQSKINEKKHITSDIVVKQSANNGVTIDATVQKKKGFSNFVVDSSIRTNISRVVNGKAVGEDLYVSDIVSAIRTSTGVDFVVTPLTRMSLSNGSYRVRDPIANDFVHIKALSAGNTNVFLLTDPLAYSTIDGGGFPTVHKGVYKDKSIMNEAADIHGVGQLENSFFIIGSEGAQIPGYTDNISLMALNSDPTTWLGLIKTMTANRVLVGLTSDQDINYPDQHDFSATYSVYNDVGVKDIYVSQLEYLFVSNVTITYKDA